jgi:NADH-quinone oxidoreductase subunit K
MNTILQHIPIEHYVIFSAILFCIGVIGVLTRRNAIILFMSVELMLNSVNLLLVAFSTFHANPAGQILVFFIMAVAAAEVAIGLAIIIMIYRNLHTVDIGELNKLKG